MNKKLVTLQLFTTKDMGEDNMRVLTEYISEQSNLMSARVCENNGAYFIEYVKASSVFKTETFPGKSVHYVEDAAENWALGIKTLNG